jgi:hypothetical protein
MIMPYPQFLHARGQVKNFFYFTVPNNQVLKTMTHDSTPGSNLHSQAAAKALFRGITQLAFTHNGKTVLRYSKNSLQVRLVTELIKVETRKNKRMMVETRPSYSNSKPNNKMQRSTLATIEEEPNSGSYHRVKE